MSRATAQPRSAATRRGGAAAWLTLGLVAAALAACGTPRALPLPALDGASAARSVEWCRAAGPDGVLVAPIAQCEEGGSLAELDRVGIGRLAVAATGDDEIHTLDTSRRDPTFFDRDSSIPGINGIRVDEDPIAITTVRAPGLIVVASRIERTLSIIDLDAGGVLSRRAVDGTPVTLASVSGTNVFAVATSRPDTVQVFRLTETACSDENDVRPAECAPVIALSSVARFEFERRITHLAGGARGSFAATADGVAHIRLFGTTGESLARCDGATPCELPPIPLAQPCGDGIDNDGDGLVDADDPQCFDASGEESPTVAPCSDGIDNDGDGFIDADDAECMSSTGSSESQVPLAAACSDGVDNDLDGKIDGDDPDCALTDGQSEAPFSACTDGLDNDGDGVTDADDPDCIYPGWESEAAPPVCVPATGGESGLVDGGLPRCEPALEAASCSNQIDDDGDGFVDLADADCDPVAGGQERRRVAACQDGVDGDGDGLIDWPDDPGCFGPSDDDELDERADSFGPLAFAPAGRLVAVANRTRRRLLFADSTTSTLLAVNEGDVRREGELGISVTGLTESVAFVTTAPTRTVRVGDRLGTETRRTVFVASASGVVDIIDVDRTVQVTGADGVIDEATNTLFQPRDSARASASVNSLTCDAPDAVSFAINGRRRLDCVENCVPEPGLLDATGLEEAEEPVGDEPLDYRSLPTDSFVFVWPRRTVHVLEALEEELSLVRATDLDDWRFVSDTWRVTFEGVLPGTSREDGRLFPTTSRWFETPGVDLCAAGVVPGDRLVLRSVSPDEGISESFCESLLERRQEFRVLQVAADRVRIAPVPAELRDEAPAIRESDAPMCGTESGSALPEQWADSLPDRRCFIGDIAYEIRAQDAWVVAGASRGHRFPNRSIDGQCIPRDDAAAHVGRVRTDELYASPFFLFLPSSIKLDGRQAAPIRDFSLRFESRSNFARQQLLVGPQTVGLALAPFGSRRRLYAVDGGSDRVFVYDANELFGVTTIF